MIHSLRTSIGWRPQLAAILAIVLTATQAGCVERRMIVRTNPPGALLYVDDYEIGTTPCATSFIYYGTRKIRLVKDGYETLVIKQPIPAPWYEYFPADFVAENLVPGHIRDLRVLTYDLRPAIPVPNDQLAGRADALRAAVKAEQAAEGIVPKPRPIRVVPQVIPTTPGPAVMPQPLPQPGYYQQPSVVPQPSYYPQSSMPPQPGYYPQPGAPPQPGYYPQPGAPPQPGYYPPGALPQPDYYPQPNPYPQPGAPNYSAPVTPGYGAPAANYGVPPASYGAPQANYGVPQANYGVPAGGQPN